MGTIGSLGYCSLGALVVRGGGVGIISSIGNMASEICGMVSYCFNSVMSGGLAMRGAGESSISTVTWPCLTGAQCGWQGG